MAITCTRRGTASSTAGASLASSAFSTTDPTILVAAVIVSENASSCTDNLSNIYTRVAVGNTVFYYYCNNNAGTVTSVTVNGGTGSTVEIVIADSAAGLATASAADTNSAGSGSSATPSSGATAATTQASELAWGVVGGNSGSSINSSYTMGGTGTYTNNGIVNLTINAASHANLDTAYQVLSATGTQSFAPTCSFSETWGCAVQTFKAAAAGGGVHELALLGVGT